MNIPIVTSIHPASVRFIEKQLSIIHIDFIRLWDLWYQENKSLFAGVCPKKSYSFFLNLANQKVWLN